MVLLFFLLLEVGRLGLVDLLQLSLSMVFCRAICPLVSNKVNWAELAALWKVTSMKSRLGTGETAMTALPLDSPLAIEIVGELLDKPLLSN